MDHEEGSRDSHAEPEKYVLDIEDIRALMPHRYPMLLVDKVLELEPGVRVVGLKNVTINEPFFNGHFPGQAIMPGVLIAEAMAQVAGLMLLSLPNHAGKMAFLTGIDKARFRKPVVPGDTLITEASIINARSSMGKVRMEARVEGVLVAESKMSFALLAPRSSESSQTKAENIRRDSNGARHSAAGEHPRDHSIHPIGQEGEHTGTQDNRGESGRE